MTATDLRNLCGSVRELVQFALDYKAELYPDAVPGSLALRAIEYTTGKRFGCTVEDALVSIAKVVNDAENSIPSQTPLQRAARTSVPFLAGGDYSPGDLS